MEFRTEHPQLWALSFLTCPDQLRYVVETGTCEMELLPYSRNETRFLL